MDSYEYDMKFSLDRIYMMSSGSTAGWLVIVGHYSITNHEESAIDLRNADDAKVTWQKKLGRLHIQKFVRVEC